MDFTEGVIFGIVLTVVLLLATEPKADTTKQQAASPSRVTRHIFK